MSLPKKKPQTRVALNLLRSKSKRRKSSKLIGVISEIDLIVEGNQRRLIEVCRERGFDFSAMSEEEREKLIDQILHEE